jgi:hypothetical protein
VQLTLQAAVHVCLRVSRLVPHLHSHRSMHRCWLHCGFTSNRANKADLAQHRFLIHCGVDSSVSRYHCLSRLISIQAYRDARCNGTVSASKPRYLLFARFSTYSRRVNVLELVSFHGISLRHEFSRCCPCCQSFRQRC